MPLRLRLKINSAIPICVRGITPDATRSLSLQQISQLPINFGNKVKRLTDCFDLEGEIGDEKIIWQGNLSTVHWIGFAMKSGEMLVEGDCGRHLGSQMSGGNIVVNGSVDDYVACENRGGFVRIYGNSGNWVGAAYPGTKSGADGGTIVVHGNVGHGCGFAMRRGTVCVEGKSGKLTGWNMLAGTILIGGKSGPMTGLGMTRGTIIFCSKEYATSNCRQLPASFTSGSTQYRSTFFVVFQNWLIKQECKLRIPDHLDQFHGDQLKGGRGEVFL